MANADTPFGLKPKRHMFLGALPGVNSVKGSPYTCAAAYATGLFQGDPVIPVAAGGIEAAGSAQGVLHCGVFWGCSYVDANGDQKHSDYIPASKTGFTEIKLDVYDDPFIIFEVQGDGVSATVAEADRFATFDLVSGAGSTVTGLSAYELDSSNKGSSYRQVRLLDKSSAYSPNDWASANVKLLVMFNEHIYSVDGGASV